VEHSIALATPRW